MFFIPQLYLSCENFEFLISIHHYIMPINIVTVHLLSWVKYRDLQQQETHRCLICINATIFLIFLLKNNWYRVVNNVEIRLWFNCFYGNRCYGPVLFLFCEGFRMTIIYLLLYIFDCKLVGTSLILYKYKTSE